MAPANDPKRRSGQHLGPELELLIRDTVRDTVGPVVIAAVTEAFREYAKDTKADNRELRADVRETREDLKDDIHGVKDDVRDVRGEVSDGRRQIEAMQSDIGGIKIRLADGDLAIEALRLAVSNKQFLEAHAAPPPHRPPTPAPRPAKTLISRRVINIIIMGALTAVGTGIGTYVLEKVFPAAAAPITTGHTP